MRWKIPKLKNLVRSPLPAILALAGCGLLRSAPDSNLLHIDGRTMVVESNNIICEDSTGFIDYSEDSGEILRATVADGRWKVQLRAAENVTVHRVVLDGIDCVAPSSRLHLDGLSRLLLYTTRKSSLDLRVVDDSTGEPISKVNIYKLPQSVDGADWARQYTDSLEPIARDVPTPIRRLPDAAFGYHHYMLIGAPGYVSSTFGNNWSNEGQWRPEFGKVVRLERAGSAEVQIAGAQVVADARLRIYKLNKLKEGTPDSTAARDSPPVVDVRCHGVARFHFSGLPPGRLQFCIESEHESFDRRSLASPLTIELAANDNRTIELVAHDSPAPQPPVAIEGFIRIPKSWNRKELGLRLSYYALDVSRSQVQQLQYWNWDPEDEEMLRFHESLRPGSYNFWLEPFDRYFVIQCTPEGPNVFRSEMPEPCNVHFRCHDLDSGGAAQIKQFAWETHTAGEVYHPEAGSLDDMRHNSEFIDPKSKFAIQLMPGMKRFFFYSNHDVASLEMILKPGDVDADVDFHENKFSARLFVTFVVGDRTLIGVENDMEWETGRVDSGHGYYYTTCDPQFASVEGPATYRLTVEQPPEGFRITEERSIEIKVDAPGVIRVPMRLERLHK
ncbi:MAG: hypothetical protein HY286_03175 [Planctomycetes bacterium]|nr:hypothetical protein [Planctomycetota bacterium]